MIRVPAIVTGLLVLTAGPVWASPPAAHSPAIVATPSAVMVNGAVRLTGAHFPKSKPVVLDECSAAGWAVPSNPCVSTSSVTVTTSARGTFKTTFTVTLCPGNSAVGTSETCYIGEPKPYGVDTIRLLGAVPVTVTWP